MGIGVSLFLMAVGAILAFAVEVPIRGIDLDTVGVILMIFGAVGLLASFVIWNEWMPQRPVDQVEDADVVVERRHHVDQVDRAEPVVERRTTTRRTYDTY
jgi:hypothetical protein